MFYVILSGSLCYRMFYYYYLCFLCRWEPIALGLLLFMFYWNGVIAAPCYCTVLPAPCYRTVYTVCLAQRGYYRMFSFCLAQRGCFTACFLFTACPGYTPVHTPCTHRHVPVYTPYTPVYTPLLPKETGKRCKNGVKAVKKGCSRHVQEGSYGPVRRVRRTREIGPSDPLTGPRYARTLKNTVLRPIID